MFGYFDVYEHYKNEEIDPYCIYVIESNNKHNSECLLFNRKYDRVFGNVLMYAKTKGIEFKIKYVRKYSKLVDVNYNLAVDELFNVLESKDAKFLGNKTTGILEKKYNKRTITKIFATYDEAVAYQLSYGKDSRIVVVSDEKEITDESSRSLYQEPKKIKKKEYLYMLQITIKKTLNNGLRQIKEYIYCQMKIKLHCLYTKCINEGLTVVGVRTDNIIVSNTVDEIKKTSFIFDKTMGGVKLEEGKECIDKKIIYLRNDLIKINDYKVNNIKIKDEYLMTMNLNKFLMTIIEF